jgi:hypothetical protein
MIASTFYPHVIPEEAESSGRNDRKTLAIEPHGESESQWVIAESDAGLEVYSPWAK